MQKLRRKLPSTKVLVLAIFPRGANDSDRARQINQRVNAVIADAGKDDPMVEFANINKAFFKPKHAT